MSASCKIALLLLGAAWLMARTLSADEPAPAPHPSQDNLAAMASSLKWQTGTVTLNDGLARLNLSSDFRFLGPADAQKVLHDLWGNPADPSVIGMLFPAQYGPLDHDGWAMAIEYEEGGYVKDDDAATIDYAALLKQMQKQVLDHNPEREKLGYPAVNLVGWAAPPRYDQATHKLYWAKEVHFGSEPRNTLNYNIRVLGRRGVLVLNAIAPMRAFPEVQRQIPQVLALVDFEKGNLYSDFDPKVDKIATYGLATLIAGGALGVAAKVGAFKFLIPLLLLLKKFVVIAVVAVVAFFKRIGSVFGAKTPKPPATTPTLPPQQRP